MLLNKETKLNQTPPKVFLILILIIYAQLYALSNYSYLTIVSSLHTVLWFHVILLNTNNLQAIMRFQVTDIDP